MYSPLPDSLKPGATLPHVDATVIAARRVESSSEQRGHDQDRFIVLALRVDSARPEYVVWWADVNEGDQVRLFWGNYYPVEYIESLARATATYHHKIGSESFALLADEIRDMGLQA